MTSETDLVEQVKKDGIKRGLFDAIKTRLWEAHTACENAAKDSLKDFRTQIEVANQKLREAEILYREWYNS